MQKVILITNIFSTFFMVGAIWLVQLVNYPLFAKVGANFSSYHQYHLKWITYVVSIPMILEAVTSLALLKFLYPGVSRQLAWVGFGLVLVIWITTIFISVPAHDQLTLGFNESFHQKLLGSNCIRTAVWSLRAAIMSYIIYKLF